MPFEGGLVTSETQLPPSTTNLGCLNPCRFAREDQSASMEKGRRLTTIGIASGLVRLWWRCPYELVQQSSWLCKAQTPECITPSQWRGF